MGKTSLATNIAFAAARRFIQEQEEGQELAKRAGTPVAFFSLEMSADQLATRILAEQSGISSENLRMGKISQQEFRSLARAAGELSTLPLYIDDTPGLTIAALRARARRLKRQKGIGMAASSRFVGVRSEKALMEISTLAMTEFTSVFASQKGLPLSRAISSANSCSRVRTTLAKRLSVSIRNVTECAAHSGQAARAAATSAAASPTGPDQISAPVAGSVETIKSVIPSPARPAAVATPAACGQPAASDVMASPIRRIAPILDSNGLQSSRSAIADQMASTSSICIEQGSASAQ